ncbi:uncharacterized protein LOC143353868 [Halictus rubicundus]|uniref:uncharacterized protein LOC143353868 n=1 Tax=Halictus rubicundus TaxID=77578 RepID=UPI004036E34F
MNHMGTFRSQLRYFHVNLHFLMMAISILTTYATTYSRLNVLQKMLKLTRMLTRQDFNSLAKFVHIKDIVFIIYHTVFFLFFATEWKTLLLHLGTVYLGGASIAGQIFYVNCVRLLGACFKKVNEHLKQLDKSLKNHHPQLERTKSQSYGQRILLLMEVKHCEGLHHEICDTVEMLNNAFRDTIIIFTTTTFTTITLNLYFSMQWMSKNELPGVSDFTDRLTSSLSVMYMGAKFLLLIYVCEAATTEAMGITTTIHKVAADCTDSTVRRELMYFARQVQHRDIKFSARTFTVNGKLLSQRLQIFFVNNNSKRTYSINRRNENFLGAVLMYTMILFQFILGANCPDQ